jgi:pimeloyl-ACP methyl ester carboxylesterase
LEQGTGFAVEAAGHRGYVEQAGAGDPVLLLPSMLVLARSYRPTVRLLSQHARALTIELPGSGRGGKLSRPWAFEDYAQWLAACLRRLGLHQPTVIGHSDSGAVALALAALHPGLVGRLVVVDTVAVKAQSLMRVLIGRAVDAGLELPLTATGLHHAVYNLVRHTRNFAQLVVASAAAELPDYLHRVESPTLIAWGARDHTMPVSFARSLQSALRHAQMWRCESGSHDWLITHAAEFERVVRSFIVSCATANEGACLRLLEQ